MCVCTGDCAFMCVSVCIGACAYLPQYLCIGQRTTFGNWFFTSTTCVPWIKLRLSGLMTSILIHWAILLVHLWFFYLAKALDIARKLHIDSVEKEEGDEKTWKKIWYFNLCIGSPSPPWLWNTHTSQNSSNDVYKAYMHTNYPLIIWGRLTCCHLPL